MNYILINVEIFVFPPNMFAICCQQTCKKQLVKTSHTQRGSGGQQAYGHALSLQLYSKFIQIVMPIMMKMDDLKQAYWLPSVFHAVLITACE